MKTGKMANKTESFLLKILSGSQFGVEVSLEDGTFTFGGGPESDIQLADMTLQPRHGSLRINGGRLEIKSEGGEVSTSSGLKLPADNNDWHEIAQLDVVSAGTMRFAVGAASAKWTKLLETADRSSGAISGETRRGKSGASGLGLGLFGVAVVLLLSVAAIYLTGSQSRLAALSQSGVEDPIDQIRSAMAKFDFADQIQVSQAVDGSIDVEGYVQSAVERRAVQNAISGTDAFVRRRIWVRDSINTEVTALIQSQGVDVTHRLSRDGVLQLDGNVLDPEVAEKVVSLVESQVFGVSDLVDNIRTAKDYLNEVERLIERAALQGTVIVRLDGLLIEASGVVPVEKTDAWIGFIQVYSKRFAKILPLRSFVSLEAVEGSGRQPVIIGDPSQVPATGAAVRVLSPELVNSEIPLTAEELFGVPDPVVEPAEAATEAAPAQGPELSDAIETLSRTRPDLMATLTAQISGGQAPTPETMREVLAALGPDFQLEQLNVSDPTVRLFVDRFGGIETLSTLLTPAVAVVEDPAVLPSPRPAARVAGESSLAIAILNDEIPFTVPSKARALATDSAGAPVAASDTGGAEQPLKELSGEMTQADPQLGAAVLEALGAESTALPAARPESETARAWYMSEGALIGYPTDFRIDRSLDRMINGADALAALEGENLDTAEMEAASRLAKGPARLLFDLAQLQQARLRQRQTLLQLPAPLSAVPVAEARPDTCWQGSRITIEKLPAILLWMDILSVDDSVDLAELEGDNRLLFMEAALSPGRIRNCLELMGSDYARMLLSASAFLSETERNSSFVEFLFRNVPVYPLELTGIDLTGERYVQLAGGRKLTEGTAPDLGSRLSLIGDLGVLIRVQNGYQASLYDDEIAWLIENF